MHSRLAAVGMAILLAACSSSDSTPAGTTGAGGAAGGTAGGAAGAGTGGAAGQGQGGASGAAGQGGAVAPQFFSCGDHACDSDKSEGCCWDPNATTGACVVDGSSALNDCMAAGSGKLVIACPGPICGAKSCCYLPANSLATCALPTTCESKSGVLLCTEVSQCPATSAGDATGCTPDASLKLPDGIGVCQYQ